MHDVDDEVVELWWCPVCDGAAHRTRRAGRPKLYCSNACRQRAYRWRRDHHARTAATTLVPAAGAFVAFGRWHALRTPRDFVSQGCDRRRREPTVCGVLAKPSRILAGRSHHVFITASSDACQSCTNLITIPIDPRVTVEVEPATQRPWVIGARNAAQAWIERLAPSHPLRHNPTALHMMGIGRSPLLRV